MDQPIFLPVPPPSRERSYRIVWFTVVVVAFALIGIAGVLLRPDPLWLSRTLGCCPVDKTHASPNGLSTIRVFITNGGATGYGAIFVYRRGRFGIYEKLLQESPAIAIPDSHTVKWINENEVEIRYTNPRKGDLARTLKVQ